MAKQIKALGVDVSYSQYKCDFSKVKKVGYSFAILRCGRGGYNGNISKIKKDDRFDQHAKAACTANMPFGVYFFSTALSVAEAEAEAKACLEYIKPYKLDYPVVMDWEEEKSLKLSPTVQAQIITAFLSTIEKAGYYGVLYASKSTLQDTLPAASIKRFDHWVAQVNANGRPRDTCTYTAAPYGMWQYSWVGKVDGITNANGSLCDVDLNRCYYDYPSRTAKLKGHQHQKTYKVTAIKKGLSEDKSFELLSKLGSLGMTLKKEEEI